VDGEWALVFARVLVEHTHRPFTRRPQGSTSLPFIHPRPYGIDELF